MKEYYNSVEEEDNYIKFFLSKINNLKYDDLLQYFYK